MSEKGIRNNPKDGSLVDCRQSRFPRELYRLVDLDKAVNIVTIAEDLGNKLDTIHTYCEGELWPHVDETADSPVNL